MPRINLNAPPVSAAEEQAMARRHTIAVVRGRLDAYPDAYHRAWNVAGVGENLVAQDRDAARRGSNYRLSPSSMLLALEAKAVPFPPAGDATHAVQRLLGHLLAEESAYQAAQRSRTLASAQQRALPLHGIGNYFYGD